MKLTPVILILLLGATACSFVLQNNERFDSVKWKNGNRHIRGQMSYDIQKSNLLIGKSSEEVRELLGEPDFITEFGDNHLLDRYMIDTKTIRDYELDVNYDLEKKIVKSIYIGS